MTAKKGNSLPIIPIIGRTNVGKSTLFNLLVKNKAIISPRANTTRDANYQEAEWLGKRFTVVDTGGLETEILKDLEKTKLPEMELEIYKKTKQAIQNSDLVIFLVDVKTGLMPQDREFANFIKKNKLNALLVVNKCHNNQDRNQSNDFFKLGLGNPIMISSASGSGVGDLLDEVVKKVKIQKEIISEVKNSIKITFIGKTNVGKSSIVNALLNENRVIVSEREHTTRDAQFIPFSYKDQDFTLVDTAGVRKKTSAIKKDELESKSVIQTKKAIRQSDVIILVTDVSLPLSVGDMKFAEIIKEEKKGLIIVANKWDKIEEKDTKSYNKYVEYYNKMMPYLSWASVLPISAIDRQRVFNILDEAKVIYDKNQIGIEREILKKFLVKIIKMHPPTIGRGNNKPRIFDIKNVAVNPLTFEISIGSKTSLHDSYIRFMEKKIRQEFNLKGVPVVVYIKKSRTVVR